MLGQLALCTAATRRQRCAWRTAQWPIGITAGPGGDDLIVDGEVTPSPVIETWYKPKASNAKVCGTVKLTWNSPGATVPARLGADPT